MSPRAKKALAGSIRKWEGNPDFERGRQIGALYRSEGRDYGKPYPSNPYHASDPRSAIYEAGYEEGFNGR